MGPLLSTLDVSKRFGGIQALKDVTLEVEQGECVGLIGPNGSGKTTLLNVIGGLYSPDRGMVILDAHPIHGLPPHAITKLGVARTFQIPKLFRKMTVLENLLVPGLATHTHDGIVNRAKDTLRLFGLFDLKDQPAAALSGGQQKLVEFARATMSRPRLLLLDEPFAALHPLMKTKVLEKMADLEESGTTLLVVSHEIPVVLKVCDRLVVLNAGVKLADGPAEKVVIVKEVIEAYIGG
jgi:ABC-type branched-subunit amino acid transport system ATPase component